MSKHATIPTALLCQLERVPFTLVPINDPLLLTQLGTIEYLRIDKNTI